MRRSRVVPQDVEEYLDAAAAGDGRRGTRLTLDALDRGSSFDDVIVNLLGAAQQETGRRWMHASWSVADEHLVSGVTQKSLDALASTVDDDPSLGPVVVTCAEGDWHSLAGQMFAEQLRGRGFEVSFLGASTPSVQVEEFLSRHRPVALAVSCNLSLFFRGVTSLVRAAHSHGVPVLAGGRGFGAGPQWSSRLGADAWAGGIDTAVDVLTSWGTEPPVLSQHPSLDSRAFALDARAPKLADGAFAALEGSFPQLSEYDDAQRARTLEDLVYMGRFAAAALLVDDERLFMDFVGWLVELLRPRGVPAAAVLAGLSALEPEVSQVDTRAGRMLLDAARAVPVGHDVGRGRPW